eukprot:CAMPEP_0175629576 /NCGR_PEP_ID=MMETSP0096-20121207/72574_1 /TAXON_ID=311494 /ORGANISM="Alexandrium monilatum, Strain CCMP3105" /LENGTH=270 /DNA_ID=CAMNT_0016934985 /DNA_START=180 /DNA_END=989 /DNA_ORIENTATION=+
MTLSPSPGKSLVTDLVRLTDSGPGGFGAAAAGPEADVAASTPRPRMTEPPGLRATTRQHLAPGSRCRLGRPQRPSIPSSSLPLACGPSSPGGPAWSQEGSGGHAVHVLAPTGKSIEVGHAWGVGDPLGTQLPGPVGEPAALVGAAATEEVVAEFGFCKVGRRLELGLRVGEWARGAHLAPVLRVEDAQLRLPALLVQLGGKHGVHGVHSPLGWHRVQHDDGFHLHDKLLPDKLQSQRPLVLQATELALRHLRHGLPFHGDKLVAGDDTFP